MIEVDTLDDKKREDVEGTGKVVACARYRSLVSLAVTVAHATLPRLYQPDLGSL